MSVNRQSNRLLPGNASLWATLKDAVRGSPSYIRLKSAVRGTRAESSTCMLLILSRHVFCDAAGQGNELLFEELRAALDIGLRVVLVHPITSVPFDHIIDTCPRDLATGGLLRCIAIQLRPPPYEVVSAGILANTLQGKAFPRRFREEEKARALAAAIAQSSSLPTIQATPSRLSMLLQRHRLSSIRIAAKESPQECREVECVAGKVTSDI